MSTGRYRSTRPPVPNCPQPETPLLELALASGQAQADSSAQAQAQVAAMDAAE